MRLMRLAMVLAAGLWLSGCVESGGPPRHWGPPPPPPDNDRPSVDNTSGGVKAALKDGCRRRYPNDDRRYRQCLEGDRHSEDALIDGCRHRYPDDPGKLRACMRAAY